jgi:hypothetical protein
VKSLETGAERTLFTDDAGRYDAASLLVGRYQVRAEKTGFRGQEKTGISLVLGQRETVHFLLQVGDVRQTVQVESSPTVVAITADDVSGLVGEQQVKELPLNGRSYDQLLTLNPGILNYTSQRAGGTGTSNSVVGNMFTASGRRPQENLYLLNGVEFTSASEINNTPGGVSGQLLGVDAVREFSVVKDTYGVEYGKRTGQHRDCLGNEPASRRCVRILAKQRIGCPQFFRPRLHPGIQTQRFRRFVGRSNQERKNILLHELRRFQAESWPQRSIARAG